MPPVDRSSNRTLDLILIHLGRVEAKLDIIIDQESQAMADLSALTTEVSENGDVIASAVTVLADLAQQVRDNATDPAALQALADELDANSNSLAEAIAATEPPST